MNTIKEYAIKILISTLAVFITAYFFDGVHIDKFTTAIAVAVVLSFLNTFLKPLLVKLTIPFTVFTFGIFLLVINAALIMLTSHLIQGFKVDSFMTAVWFSIVLSLVNSALNGFKKGSIIIKNMNKKNNDHNDNNNKNDNHFDDYEEIK